MEISHRGSRLFPKFGHLRLCYRFVSQIYPSPISQWPAGAARQLLIVEHSMRASEELGLDATFTINCHKSE